MVSRIAISNGIKREAPVKPYKPARKAEKEFGERWMHVKVVLSVDIVRREFAEMDFVETGTPKIR